MRCRHFFLDFGKLFFSLRLVRLGRGAVLVVFAIGVTSSGIVGQNSVSD